VLAVHGLIVAGRARGCAVWFGVGYVVGGFVCGLAVDGSDVVGRMRSNCQRVSRFGVCCVWFWSGVLLFGFLGVVFCGRWRCAAARGDVQREDFGGRAGRGSVSFIYVGFGHLLLCCFVVVWVGWGGGVVVGWCGVGVGWVWGVLGFCWWGWGCGGGWYGGFWVCAVGCW